MRILDRRAVYLVLLAALLVAATAYRPQDSREAVTVFAAASLRDVMQDVSQEFRKQHQATVRFNFAGSNALAQQLVAGAQADLFLSANEYWMNFVETEKRLKTESKLPLLANQLVVVANVNSTWQLEQIADLPDLPFRFLAVGDPAGVPAGIYAKRYLDVIEGQDKTVWKAVEKRLAPMPDVRRVLSLVEADASLVGIVYATDTRTSGNVRVLLTVPSEEVAVSYYVARLKTSSSKAADDFYRFLQSEPARRIYRQHGFVVPAAAR